MSSFVYAGCVRHRTHCRTNLPRILLIATTVLLAGQAGAQQLELDLLPPAPSLGRDSVVVEMAEAARRDMDVLDARASDDMMIKTITKAMRNYRRITYTLLALARKDQEAHQLAVTGIRLHGLASSVDRTLAFLGRRPPSHATGGPMAPSDIATCLTQLDRFSARGIRLFDRVDLRDPRELDAAVGLTMEPLVESLRIIEGTVPVDPWPSGGVAPTLPADEVRALFESIEDSERRVLAMQLLDQIDESSGFPDLRSRSEDDLRDLVEAIRLCEAVSGAAWLREEGRDGLMLQLDEVLLELVDGEDRDMARLRLRLLGSLATLLLRTNELDSIDSRSRSQRRDIDLVMQEDVRSLTEDELRGRIRRLGKAIDAVVIATRVRRLQRMQPGRHLLPVRRALDRDYQRAEHDVFQRILELVTTDGAMTDPDLAGLVSRQGDLAKDLELLRASGEWTELASQASPDDLKRFKGIIEGFARGLTQPSRRLAARRALGQMAEQFGVILAPPFVERLRGGDPSAIALMGGLDREIMSVLESVRVELISDWLDGSPDGEGSRRCDLLIRLLTLAESFSSLSNFGGADRLQSWGGWHLAEGGGVVDVSALAARLKVATTALVREDIDAVARQLDKLDRDMPAARLALALASRLDDFLVPGEGGVAAELSTLAIAPSSGDLLVEFRADLLDLARHTWELTSERAREDRALEREIRFYCAALAELIAGDLSRGTDPGANGRPLSGTLQQR